MLRNPKRNTPPSTGKRVLTWPVFISVTGSSIIQAESGQKNSAGAAITRSVVSKSLPWLGDRLMPPTVGDEPIGGVPGVIPPKDSVRTYAWPSHRTSSCEL